MKNQRQGSKSKIARSKSSRICPQCLDSCRRKQRYRKHYLSSISLRSLANKISRVLNSHVEIMPVCVGAPVVVVEEAVLPVVELSDVP